MIADRSDEDLMAGVASGASEALAALYDRHGTSVYSLALRVLGDPSVAEELVQEVFVRVWRQAPSYQRPRGAVGAWIISIARNLAIDELRRRGARPQAAPGDGDEYLARVPSEERDPSEQAHASMQHDVITRALDQLPPAQRQVLELAYFDGMSQSEIAAHLNDPLGTVKTRIRLGLQRLKGMLATDTDNEEGL